MSTNSFFLVGSRVPRKITSFFFSTFLQFDWHSLQSWSRKSFIDEMRMPSYFYFRDFLLLCVGVLYMPLEKCSNGSGSFISTGQGIDHNVYEWTDEIRSLLSLFVGGMGPTPVSTWINGPDLKRLKRAQSNIGLKVKSKHYCGISVL